MSTRRQGVSRTGLSRRDFLRVTGLAGGSFILAACGGAPATRAPQPAGTTAAAPGAAKIPLSFWTPGGSTAFCDAHKAIASNYEKEHQTVDMAEVNCFQGG